MPLDHYVSQVHLRKFCAPGPQGLLYAIRKSDLKSFRARPQDVCRIENNSTNAYLLEDRAVEEFLKSVEPSYNAAVVKLRNRKIDQECIHTIAGFVAYVATCSPAAMRIHSEPIKSSIEIAAAMMDAQGRLPAPPAGLGVGSLTELLESGKVVVDVDPKYTQSVGIEAILHNVSAFGNSMWEVLQNGEENSPFFTSDYPAAIEFINPNAPMLRTVPLAPDIAIRIIPDIRLSGAPPDLAFPHFKAAYRKLKHAEITHINRLLVRCAEELILYSKDCDWVPKFVAKNKGYRIEPITSKIPMNGGVFNVSTIRIVAIE